MKNLKQNIIIRYYQFPKIFKRYTRFIIIIINLYNGHELKLLTFFFLFVHFS